MQASKCKANSKHGRAGFFHKYWHFLRQTAMLLASDYSTSRHRGESAYEPFSQNGETCCEKKYLLFHRTASSMISSPCGLLLYEPGRFLRQCAAPGALLPPPCEAPAGTSAWGPAGTIASAAEEDEETPNSNEQCAAEVRPGATVAETMTSRRSRGPAVVLMTSTPIYLANARRTHDMLDGSTCG